MTEFCPRSIIFTIPGVPGVQVTAVQDNGAIDFTVDVVNSSALTGDLRGLFFHFNESKLNGLKITGGDGLITGSQIAANQVIDLGNGDNMNGAASPFDIGINFGTPGIGKGDDISFPVHFTLSDVANDLTLDDFAHLQFGARVTSIGVPGGSRPPSSSEKIVFLAPAAPHAINDAATTHEDNAITIFPLKNDISPDGHPLVITEVHQDPNSHGTVTIAPDGQSLTYTPNKDYAGLNTDPNSIDDSFIYCVSDGNGGEDHATVNLHIIPVADQPSIKIDVLPWVQGDPVNLVKLHVTATTADIDGSEALTGFTLGTLPSDVKVTSGPITHSTIGALDSASEDIQLSLPTDLPSKFDFSVTATSEEKPLAIGNGDPDTATNTVSKQIELDLDHNTTTQTFQASKQSIWGTDDIPPLNKFLGPDIPININDETFPVPVPVPPFFVPVDIDAHGQFKAGLQVNVNLNAGDIHATLPFDITINTIYNKTSHALEMSPSLVLDPSASFDTTGPEGSINLQAVVKAFLDLNVSVLGDITGLTDFSVSLPHVDQTIDLFKFDSSNAATTVPLPFPGATLNLAWPHISTHGVPTSGTTLFDSEPSNNVLTLDMDLDTMAISYFPLLSPIDPNPLDPNNPELFDTHINGGVNFVQAFTLLTGLTGELYFEDGSHTPFIFGQDTPIIDASHLDVNGDGHIDCNLVLTPHANLTNKTDVGFNVGFSFDLFHNIPVIDSLVPPVTGTLPLGQIPIFQDNFDLALSNPSNYLFSV